MISIKSIFKRKSGSKFFFIAINSLPYSNSLFTLPSPSSHSNVFTSKVKYTSTPCLPKILTEPSIESCVEPSAANNETTMKKEFNMNAIFSSSIKRHSTFRKALKGKESNSSSVPSLYENEDILPNSETSSLSYYPPFSPSI